MDLGLAIANSKAMFGIVYVDVTKNDWTHMSIVHRVPISSDLMNNVQYEKFHWALRLSHLDDSNDSSVALDIKVLEISHLPQPAKVSLVGRLSHSLNVCTDGECRVETKPNDPCRLLGSTNAVLLNYVGISREQISGEPLKLFCGIFSIEQHHKTKIKALKDTWASKCTGFLVFSTVNDPMIPSVNVPHQGEESYTNIWQKVRSIWRYIHTHYQYEYDYFLLGGDDMYLLMENLYAYLGSGEIRAQRALGKGIYLGRTFVNPQTQVSFNSGGPGYLLDAIALETLVMNLDEPHCMPIEYISEEDTFVGMCLNASLNSVYPYNTSDEHNRQRFHHFAPGFYVTYKPQYDPVTGEGLDWYSRLDTNLGESMDCCSEHSVSFHAIYEDLMYSIHDYMYHCPGSEKFRYQELHGMNYYERVEKSRFRE